MLARYALQFVTQMPELHAPPLTSAAARLSQSTATNNNAAHTYTVGGVRTRLASAAESAVAISDGSGSTDTAFISAVVEVFSVGTEAVFAYFPG